MPKRKTLEVVSTDSGSLNDAGHDPITTQSKRRMQFRTLTKEHVCHALTYYLRSLMMIDKDEEVTEFNKSPNALDVRIERITL
jgi:hypothetical protein